MGTLLDLASLVMIPSGYKDDKLYSVKPTDGSGDFTFSRDGSGASPATRVNASGLIEKGRTNELLQSNTFNVTWAANNSSVTGGQSGYDGTNDAWLLTESATTAEHRLNQNQSFGGIVTLSVYAKANTRDWLWLRGVTSAVNVRAWFNLSTGTLGSTDGAVIDHNIESVGGGWYRCSLTMNHDAAFENFIGISNADSVASYAGDGTSSIYIQDSQLEQGLVATDYIETTTAPVSAGLLGDMPRLDYSGGATCPSLLLEPQRTNLVTYSEQFDNAGWTKNDTTISANQVNSPDGYQNADLIVPANGEDGVVVFSGVSFTIGTTYTLSVFGKKENFDFLLLAFPSAAFPTSNRVALFDLNNGTIASATQSGTGAVINDYGNGWYRCSISIAATATGTSNIVYGARSSNNLTSLGNGTDGVYTWGAQLEVGSYVSSYIPTLGAAVTRAADSCVKTGISSLIGQTEGTLFVEFESDADDATNHIVSLSNGTISNRVSLVKNTSDDLRAFVSSGGSTQASILWPNYAPNTNIKAAISYKANEIVFYANGENAGTDTTASVPVSLTQIDFETSGSPFAYPVKQFIVFPTALTTAEMAALTTI